MRVAIYGAGAMGTLLGAYIASNGKQIDLITRNAGHVAALNEKGARIVGNDNFRVDVNAFTPDEMSGVYDIIFLMTKQRENSKILATLRDFLADDGVICTLQNGLPEPSVMEAVGRKKMPRLRGVVGREHGGRGRCRAHLKKEKNDLCARLDGRRQPVARTRQGISRMCGKGHRREKLFRRALVEACD